MEENKSYSRRKFIGSASALGAGLMLPTRSVFSAPNILKSLGTTQSIIKGVQMGVITYSFRSMEDQSAEATLQYILDAGINATELMGDPAELFAGMPVLSFDRRTFYGLIRKERGGQELTEDETTQLEELKAQQRSNNDQKAKWRMNAPMEKFEEMGKMYRDAGVDIYGFKPSAFSKNNTDAEIDYGFKAAKALGASHVTLEHPSDDMHTMKLGKMAAKHKVQVAYHGHEQQTPDFWDTALEQSEFNMLNPDLGHYVAAGNEKPLDLLLAKNGRIASMHLKDRQNPANGKKNMPWGTGDTPIGDILNLISKEQYKFPVTVELEYKIPADSDAVKEVQRCLGYCQKQLEG